jgi:hypothetical protein
MEQSKGSLRDVMPQTAQFIDQLRAELGRDRVDAILLRAKAGRGGFHAAEIGPDGQLREFGSSRDGTRFTVVAGKVERIPGRGA